MPASPNQRGGGNPFQPPLPLAAEPGVRGGPVGRPGGTDQGDSGPAGGRHGWHAPDDRGRGRLPAVLALRGPGLAARREHPPGRATGVAAARAALAGVTQPGHDGRADAA